MWQNEQSLDVRLVYSGFAVAGAVTKKMIARSAGTTQAACRIDRS
jgi:hypothetical protein